MGAALISLFSGVMAGNWPAAAASFAALAWATATLLLTLRVRELTSR
jgi:hypothetical protein